MDHPADGVALDDSVNGAIELFLWRIFLEDEWTQWAGAADSGIGDQGAFPQVDLEDAMSPLCDFDRFTQVPAREEFGKFEAQASEQPGECSIEFETVSAAPLNDDFVIEIVAGKGLCSSGNQIQVFVRHGG